MLEKVKLALRIASPNTAFDSEINDLIASAMADLGIVHALPEGEAESDPLIIRAVVTYCRANFGSPSNYADLKKAYDEQKAQLMMARGYGLNG